MDPVCHTLVGSTLAQSGLKRRTPLATATLVLGANLPDVDAITYLFGDSLQWRRGWTHGVLAIVLWPFVLTGLMLAWERLTGRARRGHPPARPRVILALAGLSVLSHPTLDFLNNYGLRWFMPFNGRWFYGDALFIVDPWMWAALGLGTASSWWLTRRGARLLTPTLPARGALVAVTTYAMVMLILGQTGRNVVRDALAARGIAVAGEPMVAPVLADVGRRYVVADDGRHYYVSSLEWWPRPAVSPHARVIPHGERHPSIQEALAVPETRGFQRWARFPFFVVRDEGDSFLVTMDDARYAPPSGQSWASVDVRVPKSRSRPASVAMRRGDSAQPGVVVLALGAVCQSAP